jgi:hypothetical protein
MSEPPAPRSLCIVSSDPVRSGELLAALRSMVDTHAGLEIIVDRRRGESGRATDPPPDDRRRQPFVDVKVKTDGFAIVPYPSASRADAPLAEIDPHRPELPLFDTDPAEHEYSRVLDFVRQRRVARRRRLVLASCVGAALVLLALVPAMKAFMSRTRTAESPPAESPAAIATAPPPRPTAPALPSGGLSQRSEPTPPAMERTDRPRVQARPPAAERAAQPRVRPAPAPMVMPSREVAPPAVAQPPVALPPSEVSRRPEPPAQTAKAPEVAAPRPQASASTEPAAPVQSPEPARMPEAAPTNQAPARSPEAAPPRQALGRPPDAPPAPPAPTATVPTAPPGGSPSDRRGGVGDQFKNLGTVIERDLVDATADAKRQGDDFKALQSRLRRAWEGIMQGFGGSAEK